MCNLCLAFFSNSWIKSKMAAKMTSRSSSSAIFHEIYLKGKIVSKYCNVSKTQGGVPSTHPLHHGEVCRVRVNGSSRWRVEGLMDRNPVEALIFFGFLPSSCLNWKIYCDDHSSLSSTTAVQYEFHIYFTSFHCSTGRYELNKLCVFTAQLVEHRTGIVEVTGSHPVDIFQASSFQLLLGWSFFTFIYNRSLIWISYIY